MTFVYPYKRKQNDFALIQSMKLVRKYYPDSEIYVIGDRPAVVFDFEHFFSEQRNIIKGANVTAKIIQFASMHQRNFVYMNDDFFINDKFDFSIVHGSIEMLERKDGKASIGWNQSVDNTKHFLEHNKYPTRSYECHQPVVFNSKLLIQTMDQVDWKNNDHFIKSLYFNMNVPIRFNPIDNVKLIEPNLTKARRYLNDFGCLSTGQGFMTKEGVDFISKM